MKKLSYLALFTAMVFAASGQDTNITKKLIGSWKPKIISKDGVYFDYTTEQQTIADTAVQVKNDLVLKRKASMFLQIMSQTLSNFKIVFNTNGDYVEKRDGFDDVTGKFFIIDKQSILHIDYDDGVKKKDFRFEFSKDGLLVIHYPGQNNSESGWQIQYEYIK